MKQELQSESNASKLEHLAAALIGRLLGVTVAVAKSGFQHGGDAGPAGRQGRRLRIECKKYSDTTALSERELLGELDQALSGDPALEAWVLVTTRDVAEQLEQSLFQKGESIGVPVIILDWKPGGLASLAALCAFDPSIVEEQFSSAAGKHARALQPISTDIVERLLRDLQAWSLGFETIRRESLKKLEMRWNSPKDCKAALGQDIAGGAQDRKVRRQTVSTGLQAWWTSPARRDSPAAILGYEGVGKTWATLDWLVNGKNEQPVILTIPSSASAEITSTSAMSVKRFLADRLYELTEVRDSAHWLRRLDRLLKRPTEEGPILTIFFDGLNQEPSVDWPKILEVLQAEPFGGRVRVIISTRNHHWNERLRKLPSLVDPAVIVNVDPYDTTPGGELDQMLAFEGLQQSDLHRDLIELASKPRLFKLVIKLRNRLEKAGQVTLHRLIWEYGRDTFGDIARRAFSEGEWRGWLQEIARHYRDGGRAFSMRMLGETTQRPDLTAREVFARLSEIIDGQFTTSDSTGALQINPTIVSHALGAALLSQLASINHPTYASVEASLLQWLDPIAGLDQRAEILRAAVSILVARGETTSTPTTGVLVTAWLQTQNVTDAHRRELSDLSTDLLEALLDAIEQSCTHTHASARRWAVNALRTIPRANESALSAIVSRTRRWFSIVSRDIVPAERRNEDTERHRSKQLLFKLGVDKSGPLKVLGLEMQLVDWDDDILIQTAPLLLEGFPLALATPIFEAAAIRMAVRIHVRSWGGLKWLCLLNKTDRHSTTNALRRLSTSVRSRKSEVGVNPALPARTAALLLWLTGEEEDDHVASRLSPGIDSGNTYERDYLANPNSSFFPLERRHAAGALIDTSVPLRLRLQRTRELWFDPTFEPPSAFVEEVRAATTSVDVDKIHRQGHYTLETFEFEHLALALARCAPDLLADLTRRKLKNIATCPPASRHWAATHATEAFILAGDPEGIAARTLRLSSREKDDGNELYSATQLLIIELKSQDAMTQWATIIQTGLKNILLDLIKILHQPTSAEIDILHSRFGAGPAPQRFLYLLLLSAFPINFSEAVWSWLTGIAEGPDEDLRRLAYRALSVSDAKRFGRTLMTQDWGWSQSAENWINHYGSNALIDATVETPFEQVMSRLAPWRLLKAVQRRGETPYELRLASTIIGHFLAAEAGHAPEMISALSADRTDENAGFLRFSVQQAHPEEDSSTRPPPLDAEAEFKAYKHAFDIATERIQAAHNSGANLFMSNFDTQEFVPVIKYAPDLVSRWLEGMNGPTDDFKRRVGLAESAYLALCEALLSSTSNLGARLWRVLRDTLNTHFIGPAGVDELIHIIFRAPDVPEVDELRMELLDFRYCNTDKDLFEVALAATFNGKNDWLSNTINADKTSHLTWRRERGAVLAGFTAGNILPVAEAWPAGEAQSNHEQVNRKAARSRYREACAHHWWRSYLASQSSVDSYAAWVLFLHSADRRAWTWLQQTTFVNHHTSDLSDIKLVHAHLNHDRLRRAMKKWEEKSGNRFFDRPIFEEIGPWMAMPD
ncbi:hypothetical protein [Corallococcus exiguus]|uniref:hypothetical protein n=1 Tax=Corallococcus exiguus TaxID=83462 RepID=UPI0015610726|nr:hypothetical protein [Corallococcus exiguus]NRD47252.1 hypothetical protein [Corallococcus exiguus]